MEERISKRRIKTIEGMIENRKNQLKNLMPKFDIYSAGASLPYKENLYALEVMEALLMMVRRKTDSIGVDRVSGGKFEFTLDEEK